MGLLGYVTNTNFENLFSTNMKNSRAFCAEVPLHRPQSRKERHEKEQNTDFQREQCDGKNGKVDA